LILRDFAQECSSCFLKAEFAGIIPDSLNFEAKAQLTLLKAEVEEVNPVSSRFEARV
jgi:hypothetical protein